MPSPWRVCRWSSPLGPLCLAAGLSSAALASSAPREAAAQQPPAPPRLVPPKMLGELEVPYPEGASGEAEVRLRVVVDDQGAVGEVAVLAGDEPFASAAEQAVRALRFEPATRDGRPVAATIRLAVRITPPAPPPPSGQAQPDQPGQPARPAPGPARPPAGPDAAGAEPIPSGTSPSPQPPSPSGVTVLGQRAPPGASSLTRAEVRQLPGAFGDPFRAIESLPGVTPLVSGAPFFYVRGAPPGNVGYFLDGVRVPYLFHVFLGPSVIHPALVSRVDLFPGGYPARYGRYAGAIVSAEAQPPRPELHGEAQVRLFDAGAVVEAPFAGGRGSALVGGRYSYSAALFSLASPSVVLDYWDYQARVAYDLSPGERVTLLAFGARDFLGEKREGGDRTFFDTRFHRLDLKYEKRGVSGERLLVGATLGLDLTGSGGAEAYRDRMVAVRTLVERPLSSEAMLRFGADAQIDAYDNDLDFENNPPIDETERSDRLLFRSRTEIATGAWIDAPIALSAGTVVTPGVRADLYGSSTTRGVEGDPASGPQAEVAVDPRLSLRSELGGGVRVHHAFGIAHQPPSFVVPLPGFTIDRRRGGLQSSVQTSAGVEVDLPEGMTAGATGFHNAFFRLSDALSTTRTDAGGPVTFDARAQGSSIGLELLVRRSLSRRVGGYVAYTLSRSLRSVGRSTFPAGFDRTHVLSGALGVELGRNWRAGGRVVFYTGIPRYFDIDPTAPRPSSPPRVPSFFRLDLRLEKRYRLGEQSTLSLVAEVLNTTLSREVLGVSCGDKGCEDQTIGPVIVPSLGAEVVF